MKKPIVNSLEPSKQQLNDLLEYYQAGRYADAEKLSLSITQEFPKHQFTWKVLGAALKQMGKINESLVAIQKSVQLEPQDAEAHYNLGSILRELGRLDEAEASYRQTIALKPDYALAYYNFGNMLKEQGRLGEAETNYRQATTLKPGYVKAYYNLGVTLQELGRLNEAEISYRQAIRLKPDYTDAHNNLYVLLTYNKLLLKINEGKKTYKKKKIKHSNTSELDLGTGLTSNLFILNRDVEVELINILYEISSKDLSQTRGIFFGSGRHSTDFKLFQELSKNKYPIIKKVEEDLTIIMKQAVKSDIFIMDSFFNILNNGGGSNFHHHLNKFDEIHKLVDQKYSLQYYLTIGDQKCNKPGIFKMHDPEEEVLPSEGMVMIIPAKRKHSAVYNGKTDRVMIGVNFFSLV